MAGIFIAYVLIYGLVWIWVPAFPLALKLVFGVVGVLLAVGMIKVLRDRIREIRKGENDDLSNY